MVDTMYLFFSLNFFLMQVSYAEARVALEFNDSIKLHLKVVFPSCAVAYGKSHAFDDHLEHF